MYCLTNLCYVCLETKNNLISSVDSSMSVNKELVDMFGYCAHNLTWLKTKQIILICEECCSRLRETYQFPKMWHKNSAILQNYMDQLNGTTPSNTQTEAELLVHLEDIIAVKYEIKEEQIHTDEYEPIIEETQDVFVNIEDPLTIEEHTWKKEEPDDREEYPMDNNSTDNVNNESESEISVNSNTHITNTILNTENEAEPLIQLKDINQVKCEIKDEQIYTDEYEPTIEETQDVFVNTEDPLIIKEDTWKKEEIDDREDNSSTDSVNNESDSEISVNSNTHVTDTDSDSSEFTGKQAAVTNLKRHTRIHTDEKPYKCDTCDKCFSLKHHLLKHMQTHTGEKPYKCDRCDKSFIQQHHLLNHMRTHTGEKPYKCDRCDKCFSQKVHLLTHMRTHTDEKPFICHTCDNAFSQKASLVRHIRKHTGEKPYKCDTCDKCFSLKTALVCHMRIHTGEKPYKCDRCNKCFSQKHHLLNHMRIHTGEK